MRHSDPGQPPRLAAIDVGTNSVRLLVAQLDEAAHPYRVLGQERVQCRLGEGLYGTGRLGEQPVRRTLEALKKLRETAERLGAGRVRAVATAAVREAANGAEFVRAAEAIGVPLQVISPAEEAALAMRSVREHLPLPEGPWAVADIGGGSLEVVLARGPALQEMVTLPLGAVRLAERHASDDAVTEGEWSALLDEIADVLRCGLAVRRPPPARLVGTGGTFTTMAAIALATATDGDGGDGPAVRATQGYRFTRGAWEELTEELRRLSLAERRRRPGLEPERADIIVGGAAVVLQLARHLGIGEILVHERGIRDGLLLTMIDELTPPPRETPGRDRA